MRTLNDRSILPAFSGTPEDQRPKKITSGEWICPGTNIGSLDWRMFANLVGAVSFVGKQFSIEDRRLTCKKLQLSQAPTPNRPKGAHCVLFGVPPCTSG